MTDIPPPKFTIGEHVIVKYPRRIPRYGHVVKITVRGKQNYYTIKTLSVFGYKTDIACAEDKIEHAGGVH